MSMRRSVCGVLLVMASIAEAKPKETSRTLAKRPKDELAAACKKGDQLYCMALAGKELVESLDDPDVQARALKAFDAGCTAGVLEGCSQLGELYRYGIGTSKDAAKAKALYEKACNGKDPLGCSDLGVLYAAGDGVTKDDAKAAGLYQQACDGGLMIACVNLGFMYSKGSGVKMDLDKARALYEQACTGDEAKGCSNLGSVYLYGDSRIATDRATSNKYYKKACALGDADSCDWLKRQK
jgi:TPR repeat protein